MDPNKLGMNKTGLQMSPLDSSALLRNVQQQREELEAEPNAAAMAAFREQYLREARPVGSVPVPGSLTGAVRSGIRALAGERLNVLMDKLGERLAFERSGTRLYDALLAKCDSRPDEASTIDLALLRQFRDEEANHFRMLCDVIDELGGDPTAQTPGADVSAVASMGLMQVALDPRTSVAQTLEVLLAAELIDGEGWEMLIRLTSDLGYSEVADRFAEAASEEELHLRNVRRWLQEDVSNALQR